MQLYLFCLNLQLERKLIYINFLSLIKRKVFIAILLNDNHYHTQLKRSIMRKYFMISTLFISSTLVASPQVEIKSVRGILGAFDPIEHTTLQIRSGYISSHTDDELTNSAFAIGGHAHLYTKRYQGIKLGTSLYAVESFNQQNHDNSLNPDFFDAKGNSFATIAEAYIDAKWSKTNIKIGRQSLDTPHIDSDDIRMMPNYFNAYHITNNAIENLTLKAGLVNKMAGWENGIDSSKFVSVAEVLGTGEKTDGIYFASALYEGIENLSMSLWYYHYDEIADLLYAEAIYDYTIARDMSLALGVQYDSSQERGKALFGEQNSHTFGASLELQLTYIGFAALLAYNHESSDNGAGALSLGGGAFFTSMEDQTLDAMESKGEAWVVGAGYDGEKIGLDGVKLGVAYGSFQAEDKMLYNTTEIDAVIEYALDDKLSLTLAYATIDDKTIEDNDFEQLRVIASYNF